MVKNRIDKWIRASNKNICSGSLVRTKAKEHGNQAMLLEYPVRLLGICVILTLLRGILPQLLLQHRPFQLRHLLQALQLQLLPVLPQPPER